MNRISSKQSGLDESQVIGVEEMEAARKVSLFFQNKGVERWEFGELCSRNHVSELAHARAEIRQYRQLWQRVKQELDLLEASR